jgi:hypothetical protein
MHWSDRVDWRHAKRWTIQHLGQFARVHDVVLGCRRANHPERSHVATALRDAITSAGVMASGPGHYRSRPRWSHFAKRR